MELIQVRQSPDGIHELEPENVSTVTASTVFGCSIQIATLIDRHSGIGVGTVISVREGVQDSVGLGLSGERRRQREHASHKRQVGQLQRGGNVSTAGSGSHKLPRDDRLPATCCALSF
jgi:hypothetical protein